MINNNINNNNGIESTFSEEEEVSIFMFDEDRENLQKEKIEEIKLHRKSYEIGRALRSSFKEHPEENIPLIINAFISLADCKREPFLSGVADDKQNFLDNILIEKSFKKSLCLA